MNDESMCQKCGTIHRESECPICRIAAKDKEIERLTYALNELTEWVTGQFADDCKAHNIAVQLIGDMVDALKAPDKSLGAVFKAGHTAGLKGTPALVAWKEYCGEMS